MDRAYRLDVAAVRLHIAPARQKAEPEDHMQKIKIERYSNPTAIGYQGYIEPEDKGWILFVGLDGAPLFYPHRAEDGGVLCEGVGAHNVPRIERPVSD